MVPLSTLPYRCAQLRSTTSDKINIRYSTPPTAMDSQEFIPLKHQAAGHDGCMTSGSVFAKLTSQQEIDFYEQTTAPEEELPQGAHLSHWMPTYMGTLSEGVIAADNETVTTLVADDIKDIEEVKKKTPKTDRKYIVLENLYHGFTHPSILDIKLGKILVDETATDEKRERLAAVSASTTSGPLHFRICGMKLFKASDKPLPEVFPKMQDTILEDHDSIQFDKFYGRSLDTDNVEKGIAQFFAFVVDPKQRRLLLTRFHQRLQLLYNCLLDSEVRVISGSLFFLFENDPKRWAEALEDEETYYALDPLVQELEDEESDSEDELVGNIPLSSLHVIDFAHAKHTPGEGPDENIIVGVENLIDVFEKLLIACK